MTDEQDFEKKIAQILELIGIAVEAKAKELVPYDQGDLMRSIKHKVEGYSVIVYTESPYAYDMEFGTPPGELDSSEKENITEWAKRKGLPAGPVIRKIEREGIKVGTVTNPLETANHRFRPFMRPAFHQMAPGIKSIFANNFK